MDIYFSGSRKRSDRVVVVVKGQVAVDHELDEQFRSGVHVLSEVNNVWDVMLNQVLPSFLSSVWYSSLTHSIFRRTFRRTATSFTSSSCSRATRKINTGA